MYDRHDCSRRAMERLLREVLLLPHNPAIVYVHVYAGTVSQKFYEGKSQLSDSISNELKIRGLQSLYTCQMNPK